MPYSREVKQPYFFSTVHIFLDLILLQPNKFGDLKMENKRQKNLFNIKMTLTDKMLISHTFSPYKKE